jgi:UDPglucose--hexose-1-phosphate uridylyltransferase
MAELRKDPVLGRWVNIATERVRRPADFRVTPSPPRPGPCAFCAGHEHETPPEVAAHRDPADAPPNAPGWRVRVVPNKFPALRIEGALERRGQGLYDVVTGVGAHEVIIESPDHDRKLGDLPIEGVEEVVQVCRERLADLKRDPRFRAIVIFKTHGLETGVHLGHPSSQLIATPVVPLAVGEELRQARAYHDYRERCVFCDILQQEGEEAARVVTASEHVMAFAPFAARFPFEIWLAPRRHAAAFDRAGAAECLDLARVLRTVLRKLDRCLGDPPFQLVLHTAPIGEDESPSYHWHVEIMPRVVDGEAFESASGIHANPMPPEDAARFLRDTPD